MNERILAGCGLLAVAGFTSLFAAGFYVPRPWGEDQGVDMSMANAVAQTLDGYLWVGTPAGLYRCNGIQVVELDPRSPGTPRIAFHVTALMADRSGGLWVGSMVEGLVYYRDGEFRSYEGLTNGRIKALFEDRDGTVWVGTDGGGAFHLVGHRFEPLEFENDEAPLFPTAFTQDREGSMWMGTHNSGVYRFRGRQLEQILKPAPTIKGMTMTPDGVIWLASSSGLARVVDGRFKPVPLPEADGTMTNRIYLTSITTDQEGALWMGTLTGLIRLQGDTWERFGREDGLGNGLVTSVFVDQEGSTWAGVEIGDLYQLSRRQIRLLEPFEGRLQAVNNLCVDRAGRLWVGGSSGLAAFQDGHRVWAAAPGELAAQEISAVGEDAEGRVWFATRFGDWGWWLNGEVTRLSRPDEGRARPGVIFFFRTSNGDFWAGTHNGLLRVEPDGSVIRVADGQLPHQQIISACEDTEGTLWVGTGHGLGRYRHGVFESFSDLEPRAIQVVAALHADADGAVWIGTGRGLWRHKAGRFFAYGPEHGVPPIIGQVLESDTGELWLAWGEGVTRVDKKQLNAVADGTASRVESRSLGRAAGLRGVLVSDGGRAVRLPGGLLAFAADQGVFLVDPVEQPAIETPPPVRIEGMVLNGEPIRVPRAEQESDDQPPLLLPPGYNRLEIHYAGLTFLAPERTRFRHRLRGLSEEWEDASGSRAAQFRALPPGRYQFEVGAARASGGWSPTPAALRIQVLAPWWQSAWFKAGMGASVLALAGGWYALRMRRLEQLTDARRNFSMRLLEREESERHRLSRELHDGLGQDLLILKNQVNLLEQRLPPEREDLLSRTKEIAEISMAAVEGARAIAYNLRPADLDRAGLTRSLRAMLDRAAGSSPMVIDHAIENLDGSLGPGVDVVLYRVTQELINNALKHAGAARVFVDLRRTPQGIELTVSDDGRGFDPELAFSHRTDRVRGLGLDSIQERVAMLNGELQVESAPGQGARFLIHLPLPPDAGSSSRQV
jgi:signal transduction histidine kinase/ligand-binding sensor domain-containing protein